jgi:hypothetical protein
MLLKIVYLLTCRVLGLAVLAFRGGRAKDAELVVLRYPSAPLYRHAALLARMRFSASTLSWFELSLDLLPDWAVGIDPAVDLHSTSAFKIHFGLLIRWHQGLRLSSSAAWVTDRQSVLSCATAPETPVPDLQTTLKG